MGEGAPYPDEVTLGHPASPVALCTLWTPQERILRDLPREAFAACGNLYSLWGVSLLVRGMLARPSLRFLLVCGLDYAHTGAALVALAARGAEPDGTIQGTPARLADDLDATAIARWRQQVTIVDLRGCTDAARVAHAIRDLPPAADGPRILIPEGWTIPDTAPPLPFREGGGGGRSWEPDPLGNFLIAVRGGRVVASHATTVEGPTGTRFSGRTAAEVYRAILAAGLVSRLDHAAYLGAELARAEMALRSGRPYRQDGPVDPAR